MRCTTTPFPVVPLHEQPLDVDGMPWTFRDGEMGHPAHGDGSPRTPPDQTSRGLAGVNLED